MGEPFRSKWADWQSPDALPDGGGVSNNNFFKSPPRPSAKSARSPLGEWRDGVDELRYMPRPAAIPPSAWQQILANSTSFLTTWAAQADRLCWTAADLWGVHHASPYHRLDCAGLVVLQGDAKVRALEATAALIEKPSGAVLRFTPNRQDNPGCCLAWELGRDSAA
jgi:hypothetical protein